MHLKSLVDTYPDIRFVASGSSAAALRLKSQESGAGRFTDFLLPPLTFAEFLQFVDTMGPFANVTEWNILEQLLKEPGRMDELNRRFVDYVNYGGYPEAVFNREIQADPARFIRSDIIDKVLLRDLPSLYGIQNIPELNRLFTAVAYNTGGEVSLETLAKNSGVSKTTLQRYLEYLEAAFLITRVRRIDQKGTHFHRERTFKAYLNNSSMWAALFHPVTGGDPAFGKLAETAYIGQLVRPFTLPIIRYTRWRTGEVDLVILNPVSNKPDVVLEIKWSDRFVEDPARLRSLREFLGKSGFRGPVTVTTRSRIGSTIIDGVTVGQAPLAAAALIASRATTDLELLAASAITSTPP